MSEDRLGFIGLGTMGMPMSLNILNAGKALTVWGRTPEKLQDALHAGRPHCLRVSCHCPKAVRGVTLIIVR